MDVGTIIRALATETITETGTEALTETKNIKTDKPKIFKRICDSLKAQEINYSSDEKNNILVKVSKGSSRKKLLILTGYDEPHFIVKEIDKMGFIKLSKVGNIIDFGMPGSEMEICTDKKIQGVISAKPPHLLSEAEREIQIKTENVFLDTGSSYAELIKEVSIGSKVTFAESFFELIDGRLMGNCLGSRAVAATLIRLISNTFNSNIAGEFHFAFSAAKENGYRGIQKIMDATEPDVVLFITADEASNSADNYDFKLGCGPSILINPIVNREITEKLIDFAEINSIHHKVKVTSYEIHSPEHIALTHGLSIPSIHISVPVKCKNYKTEIIAVKDFEECASLAQCFIEEIFLDS